MLGQKKKKEKNEKKKLEKVLLDLVWINNYV